jgi:hypothetical protein
VAQRAGHDQCLRYVNAVNRSVFQPIAPAVLAHLGDGLSPVVFHFPHRWDRLAAVTESGGLLS